MKKHFLSITLLAAIIVLISSCIKDRVASAGSTPPPVNTGGDSLIHYWNCNEDTLVILGTPTSSKVAGASLSYGGSRYDTVQPGTTINAVGADTVLNASSAALRLRNPSGPFILTLPTTGYKNIVLKYAEEATTKGAKTNTVSYSVDGTNYINTALVAALGSSASYAVDTTFTLVSLDFSSDPSVNNNPNFKVQITFSNASGTTTGNDRFDNITVYGVKQ
jgi:hypothetical protein